MILSLQRTDIVSGIDHSEVSFWAHLTAELLRGCQRHELNNLDRVRFRCPYSLKTAVKDKCVDLASYIGFWRVSAVHYGALENILKIKGLAHAYGLFHDPFSR